MNPVLRRLLFVIVAWTMLSGGAILSCSSDPGGFSSSNRAPVASDSFYTVPSDGSVTGFMQATDPDDDPLVFRVTAPPRIGTLFNVDTRTGQFTYRPDGTGTDSFSFRASDGRKESNTGVVTIIVEEQGESGSVIIGAAAVIEDPLVPDADLVVWADRAGTLQRIYRKPGVPAETLARGVEQIERVPGTLGMVSRTDRDGARQSSVDGNTWYPQARLGPQGCGGDGVALHAAGGCNYPPRAGQVLASAWRGDQGIAVFDSGGHMTGFVSGDRGGSWSALPLLELSSETEVSLIADRARSTRWWLAQAGETTRLLVSDDDGQSWRVVADGFPGALRLTGCSETRVCLIDGKGLHLWRLGPVDGAFGVISFGHAGD